MSDSVVWTILVLLAYAVGSAHGYLIKGWVDKTDKEVLRASWECLKKDILGIIKK